jgi:hypothetical protein
VGFTAIQSRNQAHLPEQVKREAVIPILPSEGVAIGEDFVALETPGGRRDIKNDAVIISIGGEMPFEFLGRPGISFHREAVRDPKPDGSEVSAAEARRAG